MWRDGDELVALAARTKPPKACWVTNRTGFVLQSPIVCDSPTVVVALALLNVPVVGVVLSIVAAFILQANGRIPSFPTLGYLVWWLWLIRLGIAGLVSLSLMVGLMISVTALAIQFPWLVAALVPAVLLQVIVYLYRDRVVLGLAGRPDGKHLIRLRGVHPGYLARLSTFSESQIQA